MSHENQNNDNDFLRGALHGAADKMPGGGVDDLHVSFGVVRDRVRRRRAAKIGGLTGASLALVGVLAFGATQTPLLDRADPVPPGTSESATPDASPSPTPSPTSTGPIGPPARDNIEFGFTPPWLDWSDLSCGMPVEDLESTAAGWSVAPAGDIYARTSDFGGEPSTSRGMSATVQAGEGSLDVAPVLVWSQDGVVVDFGPNVFGAPAQQEPLLGAAEGAVEAQGGAMQTCLPTDAETSPVFEFPLFEGDYEVRVVAFPEIASGQWATVVSDPVPVRIDADGTHSRTGARGGDATIEPPAPADGEVSRFELDRTTEWVTAEQTQRGYVFDDAMSVTTQCESTNPADTVQFEVVRPSTGVLGSGQITCDGEESVTPLGVLDGGEEIADIRLTDVPDGVARLWAVFAPGTGGGDAAGDCSANGLEMEYDPANSPSEGAGATAAAIVDAALACDSDRLIELANQYGTELMFEDLPPEQVFGLPENDTQPYENLVRLLAGTGGQADDGEPGNEMIVWPRVSTEEFRDSDEAWQEVVDAGLLTQAEADVQRADETFGYTGMVIAIDEAGTWRYYSPTE